MRRLSKIISILLITAVMIPTALINTTSAAAKENIEALEKAVLPEALTFTAEQERIKTTWAKTESVSILLLVYDENGNLTPGCKKEIDNGGRGLLYPGKCGLAYINGLKENTVYTIEATPVPNDSTALVEGDPVTFKKRTTCYKTAAPSPTAEAIGLGKIMLLPHTGKSNDTEKRPDGYQISYAFNRKMLKAVTKDYKLKDRYVFSGLKQKLKCYFKIRGYRVLNGKKVYSSAVTVSQAVPSSSLSISGSSLNYIVKQIKTAKVHYTADIYFAYPLVISSDDLYSTLKEMYNLYPECFQACERPVVLDTNNLSTHFWINKIRSNKAAKMRASKQNKMVNSIIRKAKQYKSKKRQVEYVNDRLCSLVRYDYSGKGACRYDAYGALVYKKAVCSGYSFAFLVCMKKLNIPCHVRNNSDSTHCWNIVKVNGKWTNIDVTWNDTSEVNRKYIWMSNAKTKRLEHHKF